VRVGKGCETRRKLDYDVKDVRRGEKEEKKGSHDMDKKSFGQIQKDWSK
jgi:hypothetical protein